MNANEIKKLQSDRLRYLEESYHESEGDPSHYFEYMEIGKVLGFSEELTRKIIEWLVRENLIEAVAGTYFAVTTYGMKIIENAITNPEQPSGPLIAYNQINIGQMINSNIQQGNSASSITQTIQQNDLEIINDLIGELEGLLKNLQINGTAKQDLSAEIETIKAQMKSSKPKKQIITDGLNSINFILQSLPIAQATAGTIISHITQLLSSWGIH